MVLKNYEISECLVVNAMGGVDLSCKGLKGVLPVKFRDVSGNFNCSHNYLTSLEGCPVHNVTDFSCNSNKLTSLKGCPVVIDGSF